MYKATAATAAWPKEQKLRASEADGIMVLAMSMRRYAALAAAVLVVFAAAAAVRAAPTSTPSTPALTKAAATATTPEHERATRDSTGTFCRMFSLHVACFNAIDPVFHCTYLGAAHLEHTRRTAAP